MKKSVTTRIKITKNEKALRRNMAQCHFRAKKSSLQQQRTAGKKSAPNALAKRIIKKQGEL